MPESPDLIIKNGSKSFALAGRFFSENKWKGAVRIYHWCRYCDDVIDENGDQIKLSILREETRKVLHTSYVSEIPPFQSLSEVAKSFSIPTLYFEEMLNGMEMDIKGFFYQNITQLEIYCYRVAGTVGLMMCSIMGIFSHSALEKAAHLGIGMQLTNIARDIREDYDLGRIYLPEEWLQSAGVNSHDFFLKPDALFSVVLRMLNHAESFYESGMSGTKDLPLRSAFVITVAALFYREIGIKIRKMGPLSFQQRAVISLPEKIFLIMKAFIIIVSGLPARFMRKKQTIIIDRTWSPL